MTHADDVSFYIPVRNAARTLPAAIASIRAQTVAPVELLLVVDTRSQDDSVELARQAGLRIIEQHDGCLGHARNLALRACHTRWLASCDADVTLEPRWLETLLERRSDGVAAVGGGTLERPLTPADRWRAVNMPHNWGPLPLDNPFMLVSEMLADVSALRSIGGYRADLQAWEDSDACQRLRHAGYTLRYEPAAVAHHDRRDSVQSVLDLRWFYAAYRQRTRLESLPGLVSKLAVNRGYCIQSLSQTLHSEHADTCAIAVLLWFHHARADLAAALEKWPLLEEPQRRLCLGRLTETLLRCLRGRWRRLLEPLCGLLSWCDENPDPAQCDAFDGGTLAELPGFAEYLAAAGAATSRLLDEVAPVGDALLQSALRMAAGDESLPFEQPVLAPDSDDEEAVGTRTGPSPAWSWPALAETLREVAGEHEFHDPPRIMGPSRPPELPVDDNAPAADGRRAAACRRGGVGPRLVLYPHLEAAAQPRSALRAALADADAAAIAYQPPDAFIPAIPILTARDLAICCAEAGFTIRQFHTEAGLTRLIVARI